MKKLIAFIILVVIFSQTAAGNLKSDTNTCERYVVLLRSKRLPVCINFLNSRNISFSLESKSEGILTGASDPDEYLVIRCIGDPKKLFKYLDDLGKLVSVSIRLQVRDNS